MSRYTSHTRAASNENKFSAWSTRLEVLGLEFDTELKTASMPIAKINKALQRVERMAQRRDVSRHDLECLLGSLRHVCICLPSAIPFHQRLHTSYKCAPRRGRIPVSDSLRLALAWLRSILMRGDWRGLPTQLFWTEPVPDVHVYMDASK